MKHTLMVAGFIMATTTLSTLGVGQNAQPKPMAQTPTAPAPPPKAPTAAGATTPPAAAAMPTVDQVLDKYVQALGGRAAAERLTSRLTKGTFEMPAMGVSAPVEDYRKAPNKMMFILNIPGFGVIQQGYNSIVGWSQDPQGGMRELSGPELAMMKRGAEFHRQLKLKQLYPQMIVKGKETVGGREVYVVEATPAEGGTEKMYFDTLTGLLVRYDFEASSPQGKLATQTFFDDYREADGVKTPFAVRQSSPAGEFIFKFSEVKHNVPVDDAKFNKPAVN